MGLGWVGSARVCRWISESACDGSVQFGHPAALPLPAVLALLLRLAQNGSPCHHMQQPALSCLAALAEQQPSVADWLLADADARCTPLLLLAFHPMPAVRQAVALLLDTLLFGTAARQLRNLAAQLADGPCSNHSTGSAAMPQAAAPEPFCASYLFARPTAVLPVAVALHPRAPASIFASEGQQRLWRARQLCSTAAARDEGGSTGSLVQMLSGPLQAATPARWEADLVRSSLSMLRGLQPEEQVADGLRQLAASESHQQCHAALRRLQLLVTALPKVGGWFPCPGLLCAACLACCVRFSLLLCAVCPCLLHVCTPNLHPTPGSARQGLAVLAAAPWRDALDLLLSAAPLSHEDCALWVDMLPLLQQLLGECCSPGQRAAALEPQLLLRLSEQFAGGSALGFVKQQAGSEDQHAAALLPAVLHTVRLLAQHAARRSSAEQRALLLDASRTEQWLELVSMRLEAGQWGYAARVAALQLAAALLEASRGCTCPASSPRLLAAAVRQVLMPRELWDTHHCHGKAAVLAGLQLLLNITQLLPAAEWAEAWMGIGSTFWLSRAAGDASPAVRQAALQLLAAALAVPATWDLLAAAWPECGEVAVRAALDCMQPAGVRAAALCTVAAALSHGLGSSAGSTDSAVSEAPEPAADGQDGEAETAALQLALLHPLPSCAAEHLLLDRELWTGVEAFLQVGQLDAAVDELVAAP